MEDILYSMMVNDEKLIKLLGSKNNIYPIFATSLNGNVIEYEYRDIKNDLIITSNFSINIVGANYDTLNDIKKELYKLFLNDLPSNYSSYDKYQFNIMLSGAGAPLYRDDKKIYMINLNFLIRWREYEKI